MNQVFGSCVSALTTDYEIRRNGSSPALYFSPLLDPTLPHTRRDGRPRVRGRLVGRSVGGIKFHMPFSCAGSLGRRAFQAVGSA